ncbi:MAG: hypothetical protein RL021_1958 [Bacteroidota bacterium]|jgi:hypothetical protein
MQARRTELLMGSVFLFLSLGGFFQLSVLRLSMHHAEQRSITGPGYVLRLTEKSYKELLQDRDELRIGGCWYDVSSVDSRDGEVIVRLHRDAGESYWRELMEHASGKTTEKKMPVTFLFYYLTSSRTISEPAPTVEKVTTPREPSVMPTPVADLFRPPCYFSTAC